MKRSIKKAISNHFDGLLNLLNERGYSNPTFPWNEDIDDLLYIGEKNNSGWVEWRHKEKTVEHSLTEIEQEYGITLHHSIKEYFNSYWFLELEGCFNDNTINFIEVPPGKELSMFKSLLKSYQAIDAQLKHIPIGSETMLGLMITINNQTGEINIYDHERGTYQKLADGLAELISAMDP